MRRAVMGGALAALCIAGPAAAYEFTLQFTPAAGARGLVVAGYAFTPTGVMGNCSFYTSTSSGGRGGHTTIIHFNQTCHWDLRGNLLGIAQGAPTAPTPISSINGVTIYAKSAKGYTTGLDTTHGAIGFVNVPSAQYAWLTPSGGYMFLSSQAPVTITLSVQNIGDLPLKVSQIVPKANLAKASVKSTSCKPAKIAPAALCSIVLTYDPSGIPGGDDPYTAYDSLAVSLVSNSGQAPIFTQSIEVPISPAG